MANDLTPAPLMKMAQEALWSARTLAVATELEIFTRIDQGKNTIKLIAEDLSIEERPIEMLLNACVSLELLTKNEGSYENTPISSVFLVKGKSSYYGDMIVMTGTGMSNNWANLKQCILTNSPAAGDLSEHLANTETAKEFTRAMHNNAVAPARVLSEKIDFSEYSHLLDLGGGSGVYSIILTKKYSNLKATVFELPFVCEITKEFVEKEKADKVETVVGDYLKDSLANDFDVALLSQVLHAHSIEDCKFLLKKIYNDMKIGGLVIVNEFLLNENKTGPKFPALFALNMLLISKSGNSYTASEISSWLEEAGFKEIKSMPLAGPVTTITAKKL